MRCNLTLDDVVEVTGGALIDGPELVGISGEEVVTSVSTDSRTLESDALFVALRGERHDGHDHVLQAVKQGAAALLVERPLHDIVVPQVVVIDALHAFGDIARYVRDDFDGPVIGITGSVGKTTTKEMVAAVLAAQFRVRKSEANHNNEIGLPQTIFAMAKDETALVLEMGMRGPGQIRRLCEIGAPNIGIITNIGHSHEELLGSQDAIAAAKGELFELLPEIGGVAIYPVADPYAETVRARFRGDKSITCGLAAEAADVRATGITQTAEGWTCNVETPWGSTLLTVPSPGRFNILNALFAVAVGGHLGIPLDKIAAAIAGWTPPEMRMQRITSTAGVTIFSDAYNAAPDSVVAALETLRDAVLPGSGGQRIAVLGEMRELGDYTERAHRLVGQMVAITRPDMLILVGPLTRTLEAAARMEGYSPERIHFFATTAEAVGIVPPIVQPGDAVLVKGSRALGLERVVEALRK